MKYYMDDYAMQHTDRQVEAATNFPSCQCSCETNPPRWKKRDPLYTISNPACGKMMVIKNIVGKNIHSAGDYQCFLKHKKPP